MALKERFDEKWIPEPNTGCHLWLSSVGKKGYGKFWYDGGCKSAHKIAYFLHYNYYPTSEEHVLHKCDTPECVNPLHLFLGDNFVNQKDCVKKGRHSSQAWETHTSRKLSKDEVLEIRERLKNGKHGIGVELANKYNVHPSTITAIKKNRNWNFE